LIRVLFIHTYIHTQYRPMFNPLKYCNVDGHSDAKQRLSKQTSTIERLFSMDSAPPPLLCCSSVNTAHYATIEEAMFSMSSAPSSIRNGIVCDQLLDYATVLTIEL
jgi:hypothetical protein